MTVAILLLTCLLLTPWLVQFARYSIKRPEAIPTPTWLVTSSFFFLFLFPLIGAFVSGESLEDRGQAAIRIMFTTIVYWVVFTGVYLLAAGRSRTVMPDGPRGIPTSFGVLKQAAESTTMAKAMIVFIPLTLIKLYFLLSSGLGMSGGGLAILDLPYHLVILRLMTTGGTTAFSTVFAMQLFGKGTQGARLAAAGGILTNLAFAVMAGRRPVLFTLALVTLGVMWSGRRRQAITVIGLGVAVWFLLYVFSPIFLRARAIWRSPDSPGVMAAFEIAMRDRDDSGDVLETESEENIKQRMNTYRFWLSF